jgi:hypothetical protein
MKAMRQLWIAAAVLVAASAVLAQPVTYESRRVERVLPGCGDDKNGCAHVELDYVEITGGAAPDVCDRINQAIVDNLVHGGPKMAPEQYADRFIANYTIEDNPRGVQWALERKIKILRATPPMISLESSEFGFTGGAHPYSGTTYLNFNTATGKPVQLSDILKDGALPKLTEVAEGYFRRERNLAPDADLKEEGFSFFKDNRFALNENFGIGEDALVFTFNAYEVAPYAWGPTEFAIPFSVIRDLLRPESGL